LIGTRPAVSVTWAERSRPDNKIVAGKFWAPDDTEPQFSVEEGIAQSLGIKLGDTLAFDIAGSKFSAKVTSLRKVDWDSFKPNFFVIANPQLLKGYPASWITSFHLPQL
jgi:putative ABC transport system permease protein